MIVLASRPCRAQAARGAVNAANGALPPDSFVARVLAGEEAASEQLVREHGGRMLAVAARYLRSADDAADAVQDAFLAAFSALGKFRGESSLGTWLHRIVVNVCLMKLRSRPAQPVQSLDALLPAFDRHGRHAVEISAWGEGGAQRMEQNEMRALVRAGIDRLPGDHREILLLRDIDGFDTTDTAELLGISRAAVKTRLHRARQALRTLLAPHFAEDLPPTKKPLRGNRLASAASKLANR